MTQRRRPLVSSLAPPVGITREIAISNRHPRLRVDRRAIARVIELLDANVAAIGLPVSAVPAGELSIVILTDPELAQLHADFLDDPTTTDVITFEGNADLGTAGEICVSADTADAYARKHRREFSTELTLYLVHGWLHLGKSSKCSLRAAGFAMAHA